MNLKTVITESTLTFQNDDNEALATLTYSTQGDVFIITRTNVSEVLRGQGMGGKLMDAFYSYAKESNKKIQSLCSYATAWFEKNPEKMDVLDD